MAEQTAFNEERAKSYDTRIRQHIPGYEILHGLAETILAAELPETASLLVAGVGTGMEVLEWAPKHPQWTFLGVDPSLKTGTVDSLPAESFDAATLLLVLHFLPDHGEKEELLTAIAERLKPGAPFLMATMFGDRESTRHKRLLALTQSWAIAHGMNPDKATELCNPARADLHVVPEERVKNLLRYAGFIDVQRVYQALTIGLWLARAPR